MSHMIIAKFGHETGVYVDDELIEVFHDFRGDEAARICAEKRVTSVEHRTFPSSWPFPKFWSDLK